MGSEYGPDADGISSTAYNGVLVGSSPTRLIFLETIMPKRVLDKFDLEAEREGSAMKKHTVLRVGWGKGITKQRNMHKRGGEILTTLVVNRMGVFK